MATTAADRAPGLSERTYATISHCGVPMSWKGSHAHWTGQPGQGTEHHRSRLVCAVCGAEAVVTLREPC